jgi:hypothetical protein
LIVPAIFGIFDILLQHKSTLHPCTTVPYLQLVEMYVKTGFLLAAWATATASAWRGHSGEVQAQRSYMYVGGQYILDNAGQHVFTDQMYVEKLVPAEGATKPYPIVFIHGQAQTGTVRIIRDNCSLVPPSSSH